VRLAKKLKQTIRKAIAPPHAVILTYHSAVNSPASFSVWQHNSATQLEEHFAWISRNCNCISLQELIGALARGRLEPDTVAITFDDGYANNLHVALPLLERYKLPATFFVVAGCIGSGRLIWTESLASLLDAVPTGDFVFRGMNLRLSDPVQKNQTYRMLVRHMRTITSSLRDAELEALAEAIGTPMKDAAGGAFGRQLEMMSWDELRQLAASEYAAIGAHTMSHPWLIDLPDDDARKEIADSRQLLEKHVGVVDYFAYPFGGPNDFGSQHRQMAVEAGFKAVFTAISDCVTVQSDPLAVPRWGIGGSTTRQDLEYALTGGLAAQQGLRRWSSGLA
jgi:peptidoglycan/xylan/chitin deacetylase (PgdA/CDA1 family)